MIVKQVIVIRKDLNMRKGKMIAQGAHASMKVFFDRLKPSENGFSISLTPEMQQWVQGDFRKIVVYVNSEQELLETYKQAVEANLPCALIQDNGLTEFKGIKTYTAVAIGPASDTDIDKITKDLPLL
jgi:PTH2 family peptidyl-tRNA hydrolase